MTNRSFDTPFDLYSVEDFLDGETCVKLIDEIVGSPRSPAVTYSESQSGSIDERVRRVARVMPSREAVNQINTRLEEHRLKVAEHFGLNLNRQEEPQFLCYSVGDFFVAHQDGNTGLMRLDTDRFRHVSLSLFLNPQSEGPAANSYCGGSLVFSDWRTEQKFEFKGAPGTLVAFRAETTHEVTPVTHGERYAIVSWYGSD